jgi:5-formyltetrahydrofolate cyclo-ligase
VTLAEVKDAARKAAYAARKTAFAARTPGDADHLARLLDGHAGQVLSGYMPMRTEIDPLPAMAVHTGCVGVPVIVAPGQPLRFRRWTPNAPMVMGSFGALIPESGDWVVPRVLIVPLLAFDRRGYRLGYGGGFYDRTLEGLRAAGSVTAIGFAFAGQEVPEVPIEATDQPLDLIVTEVGVITPAR